MLTFNLKKEWYEKIRSGEKTIEYREVKPYWTSRLRNQGCLPKDGKPFNCDLEGVCIFPVFSLFRLGYTRQAISARITKVEIVNGKDTDLAIDAPVYAVHLAALREIGK